jgi:hypothetical protein
MHCYVSVVFVVLWLVEDKRMLVIRLRKCSWHVCRTYILILLGVSDSYRLSRDQTNITESYNYPTLMQLPKKTGNEWITKHYTETKSKRKLKGQSGMNNPETLATLVTQDTEQKQTKQKIQHRNPQRWETRTPPKTGNEPRCSRKVSSSCFL